jgi:Nif-specific regulatory protein
MSKNRTKIDQIELTMIYEVGKILCSSLSLDKSLHQLLEVIASHLNINSGMISLAQESGIFRTISSIGLSSAEVQHAVFKKGEGITGKIYQHGIPIVIPDISDEPLFLNKTGALRHIETEKIAFVGVPIKVGSHCIGVFSMQFKKAETFAGFQSTLRLLSMVARLIGQSWQLNENVSKERHQLLLEKSLLQKALNKKFSLDSIIGESQLMQEVFSQVHLSAGTSNTILLRGESGTGKEQIARAIHALSPRKSAPFIKTNCGALSENLLESELFGHEKGAFTGATHERAGRFEQADGGTLFLDEIGDISPSFQVKLLRVLQEREFERVGGNKTIKINVRIICATHRNLEEEVKQGRFRADLYYRINVISIHLPPLRERKEDIPLLTAHILNHHNQTNATNIQLTERAIQVLMQCQWPGNVRELENCIARSCTLSRSQLIDAEAIPCQSGQCMSASLWKKQAQTTAAEGANLPLEILSERDRLINMMEKNGWVQAKAARALNLTPRQVAYALKKHRITIKKF